jgi:hypothetical protein
MPQETNLNVSPYFDDFDANKDYYKVLFKPGYPIQARELNTTQSILQNQVEQFGKNIFKDGSRVNGAEWKYDNPVSCIQIEDQFTGIPVSLYFDQLKGKKIRSLTSGVTARVVYILEKNQSERSNYTLYLQYLQSGGEDFTTRFFVDGETLVIEEPVTYGNFTIQPGQGICNTIVTNANSTGSLFSISNGVYFINGFFTSVREQTIILDQYGIAPSYKVGFNVIERIVNSEEDPTLTDNAQGFSNYAAPGADRFQIELELTKKKILDLDVEDFVEIFRVESGVPTFLDIDPQYNLIRDYMAKRTFDESGNFFVKPFTLFVRDSLNDRVLNNGIYFEDQKTISGSTPSEDMMVYQIGPGKAYVNGYDVEVPSARLLEVPKPRTTETRNNIAISYNAGSAVLLNRVYGGLPVGLGTDTVVSLIDSRIGTSSNVAVGTTIGVARIYDLVPETDYTDDTSRFELRLFDIETYTQIGVSTSFSSDLTTPTFIEGRKSNASGYLRSTVSAGSAILTLYEVSGSFLENEPIRINGIDDGRLINFVKDYSISDIKSIYSNLGFNADVVLSRRSYIAKPGTTFKISNGVVSAGFENVFINIIKSGDIISYASNTFTGDPIYNKVVSVGAAGTSFVVTGITTVSGICDGFLDSGEFEVTNIIKISPSIDSTNSSLLTRLNDDNIESIQFEENEILQRRTFLANGNGTFSGNTINITIDPSDTDIFFESFDEDRYYIYYGNGKIENVRRDKFNLSSDGKTVTFVDLSESSGTSKIIATVKNLRASSKIKKFNAVSSLIVDKSKFTSSGIGTTTLNDGLSYSQVYGLRVQDNEISLNVPDVVRVLAVYESTDTSDPELPIISFTNGTTGNTNTNQDFNIGEWIIGKNTGAVGLVVSRSGVNGLEYVYLNTFQFAIDEVIEGKDTKTQAIITNLTTGGKNITQNYLFDDGQRDTYYDYGRLVRKKNVEEPKKKLKIIFQNFTIDASDTGEFITVNSYSKEQFKNDVLYYQNSRLTDFIDIRPRVAPYVLSSRSPFEFDSRKFDSDGQYSKYILVPGENIVTTYSYYVGRIDRVFLNPDGTFEVSQGIPNSLVPSPLKSNSLDISTVYIPPYVYNVKNINVNMSKYKRYRMSDISLLEDRIQRVEQFTTLSMLESKTENFTIRDAETGLDRFKCGFFVDNFSTHEYHDLQNPSFRSCIDTSTNTLRPPHYTTSIDLQLGSEVIAGIAQTFSPNSDQSYVADLGSPGIRKTGDLITLNYNEVLYFEQPYATKTESVTPFLVRYWLGRVELRPPIDSWVEERAITTTSFNEVTTNADPVPDENITIVNDVVQNREVWTNPPINQTGVPPFDWITNARSLLTPYRQSNIKGFFSIGSLGLIGVTDSIQGNPSTNAGNRGAYGQSGILNGNTIHLEVWKSSFTSQGESLVRQLLPPDVANDFLTAIKSKNGNARALIQFNPETGAQITETRQTTTTTETSSNTSSIIIPPEVITTDTTSDSISNFTEPVRYLRSRNIEFDARGLRPVTRFYTFFEGIDVSRYIIPKLLEIEMISGSFQIGETVESDPFFSTNKIVFRVCKPNHRTGPFDGSNPPLTQVPTGPTPDFTTGEVLPPVPPTVFVPDTYRLSPYTQQPLSETYSESSTVLNIDTRSLQLQSETDFYGSISPNMRLIGKSSGAVARISNIRLISDNQGRLIGSLFVPDPNVPGNPQWINGENTFTVIDTETLDQIQLQEFISNARINQSSAESEFASSAISNVTETNILTTRNVTIIPSRRVNTTTITNTTTNTTTITQTQNNTQAVRQWETHDPLAQSFYVREDTGLFLTSVEVFFETKDEEIPVTLQIRPITNGVPSNVVVPFSEVTLEPEKINLSIDGSIPTRFTFSSPVYLPGPNQLSVRDAPIGSNQTSEFSVVLLSNSPQYRVFIAELGFNDIQTGVKLTDQPTLGSLFKSQNGTTWSPAQLEDLKYRLNRADFVNEGLVKFFNPKLSIKNKKVTVTGENQIIPLSKRIIVGLGSTGYDVDNVVPGVTLTQGTASSELIGIGGSIESGINLGVNVSNPGFGYTAGTFSNIALETETGSGKGAVATIGVTAVGISTITITNGGFGYQVGDSLLIPEVGLGQNVGFGGRLTVSSISSNNTFILDSVQGSFSAGSDTVFYLNSVGAAVTIGPGVNINTIFEDPYYDGLHLRITQMNHGMHSPENYVKISSMRPLQSEVNSRTTSPLTISSTTIPLVSLTGFELFEGISVSPSNPGYVIIGDEVVEYTSVSGNSLILSSSSQRGVDGTIAQSYNSEVPVFKYEFNGISLRRINKIHNFAEVDIENHPIDLNSYFVKIDNSGSDNKGTDRSNDLYFKETIQSGSSGTVISNNIQFEAITPNISNIIPVKTNLTSRIRTFTGTSVGGIEKSFVDDGFLQIPLEGTSYLSSPRLICSEVNEERFITESPGNKSFTMEFLMTSSDSRVSPVIDTIRTSAILTSNLINNPLGIEENSDYANDDRVRALNGDPHSTIYISKSVRLKLPANSIKVLLSASRNDTNDIRVLYQLFRDDAPDASSNFELFPGHSNYRVDGIGIKRVIDPSLNDGSADSKVKQSSDRSFRDYEYSVDDLPDFSAFAIKIVMAGSNQATPPLIKQLRAIATIKPKV